MDILKYREYEGSTEIDMDRGVCRGKVLFIDDLVTFQSDTPKGLQHEFELAVEDYIETCATLGRAPKKPLKGAFNVRISPELHKEVALRAATDEVSQNEVVARAIEAYVCTHQDVNHNHSHNVRVTVDFHESAMRTIVAATTPDVEQKWETLRVH